MRQFLLELGVERLKHGARLLLFGFGLYDPAVETISLASPDRQGAGSPDNVV